MERDTILVPTDFTPVADSAMDHAIEIASLFDHRICLMHVIGKKAPDEEREKVSVQLSKIAAANQERSSLEISYRVEEGSIFEEISRTADSINAEFIVMGIHGKKGIQHITGSYAYKVIENSKVPVIIVKKKHHHVGYKKIVIPVDFTFNSSMQINTAIKFSKYFGSEIHVIGVLGTNSSIVKLEKEVLLKKVTTYIEAAGAKAIAEIIVRPGAEIHDEILDYSNKIDADLIMIVAERSDPFAGLFGQNDAEHLIDNAEIPILTFIPNNDYDADDDRTLTSFFDPFGLIDKPM